MNPEKFEKKDHIFMDFFSMYGNYFVHSKKGGEPEQQLKPSEAKSIKVSKGAATPNVPYDQFY